MFMSNSIMQFYELNSRKRIKEIYKYSGLTKKQFARYFGMYEKSLDKYFNEKIDVKLNDIEKFCNRTQIDMDVFTRWLFIKKLEDDDKKNITEFFKKLKDKK